MRPRGLPSPPPPIPFLSFFSLPSAESQPTEDYICGPGEEEDEEEEEVSRSFSQGLPALPGRAWRGHPRFSSAPGPSSPFLGSLLFPKLYLSFSLGPEHGNKVTTFTPWALLAD